VLVIHTRHHNVVSCGEYVSPEGADVGVRQADLGRAAAEAEDAAHSEAFIGALVPLGLQLAGVRRFRYLVQAVRRAGARKLIFGPDGPWPHPGLELHKIRLLGLSADDEAAVLGGTLLRLLDRTSVGKDDSMSVLELECV
jgi:hypothetical protein